MSSRSRTIDSDAYIKAVQLLGARHLHQCLFVPATNEHGRVRVTFATTSNFDDETAPVILFVGPMYGTRYFAAMLDHTCRTVGVRVIYVDRPGLGGSAPVPVAQRLPVWLETVPLLLQKLKVEHVSILSHSAGTVYSMNTLTKLRYILDPRAPFISLLGPWVHQDHSHAALWNVVGTFPKSLITCMDSLTSFINGNVVPVTSWSGGIVSSTASLFRAEPDASGAAEEHPDEIYGTDRDTAEQIVKLRAEYFALEETKGANDEALFLLKKGDRNAWGVCEDYMTFARNLAADEKARLDRDRASARLKVRIFFAESDVMIGKGGTEYFSNVWQQDGLSDALDVQIHHCKGTNHETVLLDYQAGGILATLKEVKRLHDETRQA